MKKSIEEVLNKGYNNRECQTIEISSNSRETLNLEQVLVKVEKGKTLSKHQQNIFNYYQLGLIDNWEDAKQFAESINKNKFNIGFKLMMEHWNKNNKGKMKLTKKLDELDKAINKENLTYKQKFEICENWEHSDFNDAELEIYYDWYWRLLEKRS